MMGSADFVEEIDCSSFFDQIDDLIDFPAHNGCGVGSGHISNNFPSIWPNSSDFLPGFDPSFSGNNSNSVSNLSSELSVPFEDIVQLEWLSNFVEDSFSGGGMTFDKQNINNHFLQTTSPVSVLDTTTSSSSSTSANPTPLHPTQCIHSKWPRPATLYSRQELQLASPTSSLTENPQLLVSSESEIFVESHPTEKIPKAAAGEQKKKKIKILLRLAPAEMNQNPPSQPSVRKCMHCEITKTPQWRAGPMGAKSLCNACGVRYKSGRLFPEYRPAASPTFVPSLHSNSHKKVIEMRTMTVDPEILIPNRNPSLDF